MLNLSGITSKFRTVAMFVIVELLGTFHTGCVSMVTICHHTNFACPAPLVHLSI